MTSSKRTPAVPRRKLVYLGVLGALATTAALVASTAVDARITKVTISSKESPTFGGYSWPGVGQYEKIVGIAYGELDPNDPHNAVITDIKLAPRNAAGKVEYSHAFYIVKPIDLSKGNRRMVYDVVNRGALTLNVLNRSSSVADLTTITDAQSLSQMYLPPRGYTIVASGWDFAAGLGTADNNMWIKLPVAKNPDGSSITGPGYEYIVTNGATAGLTYAAATLDKSQAKLTHRVHLDDVPQVVPSSGWNYNSDGTAISLVGGNFVNNDIYEFSYTAKDPSVNGIGFAAVRDFLTWLKFEAKDDLTTVNPLAGDVLRIYAINRSQPARMMNDYRNLGFNASEGNRKVIDAILNWVGASSGINMNYRFSNPGTTQRNRQDQLYTEAFFPFANESITDHISGITAGRYDRCTPTVTCPLAMEVYSSNEYWVKAASLGHTNTQGTADLPGHPMARHYLISSHQHSNPGNVNSKGSCQQFGNPLASEPVQRALWEAMDAWSTRGVAPPPSQIPRFADGTLVAPLPQSASGFPNIPGVTYTGLKSTRYRFNYGPNFYVTGIPTIYPPVVTSPIFDNPANGPIYPSFVPKVDADGNEIAGIRLPDVRVPIRTYSGWSLRSGAWANDGCEGTGQSVAFPATKAARESTGDPRLSVAERYPTFLDYYYKVTQAINDIVAERFMLAEDAGAALNRMLNAGFATGAIKLFEDDPEE